MTDKKGERMYAITESDLLCIKMLIEDNANHDDEILDIVRNALLRPLSCMERNGARGQQGISTMEEYELELAELTRKVEFYKRRADMLQCWQSSMRDPERKIVCDILANGFTLTTKEDIKQAQPQDAAGKAELDAALTRLDKEIAIRENEMNRKCALEDNITTASGYAAAAGALNWVRVVLIEGMRETVVHP